MSHDFIVSTRHNVSRLCQHDVCIKINKKLSCGADRICLVAGAISCLITSLAKEVMFLVALVCLFVDNITQNVFNGLG